jgi:hypothetical protein
LLLALGYTLVICGKQGYFVLIYSKEGFMQVYPLSMFGYGISVLPLLRQLKKAFPLVKQPWYANNTGAGGRFTDLRLFFE